MFVKRLNKYKVFEVCKECWKSTQKCTLCDTTGHLRNGCPNKAGSADTAKTALMTAGGDNPAPPTTGFTFAATQQQAPMGQAPTESRMATWEIRQAVTPQAAPDQREDLRDAHMPYLVRSAPR